MKRLVWVGLLSVCVSCEKSAGPPPPVTPAAKSARAPAPPAVRLKQALELAMVLAAEPDVVLLDEPTAGLSPDERAAIGALLVDLARTHGLCILLVEHDLDFVREISTRLVVLHQGRVLLDGSVREVVASDLVRTIYAGSVGATA